MHSDCFLRFWLWDDLYFFIIIFLRDQGWCERVCSWTRHLHHTDHSQVRQERNKGVLSSPHGNTTLKQWCLYDCWYVCWCAHVSLRQNRYLLWLQLHATLLPNLSCHFTAVDWDKSQHLCSSGFHDVQLKVWQHWVPSAFCFGMVANATPKSVSWLRQERET